jgi:eukaryotic-like serine/threonine-protein kinase
VKVVDFGIARAEARSKATRAGVVKGKQGYMSPEQCRGDAVDRRSDVFGLGILLWELTVGRRLFTGDNDYAVMSKIVFGMVTDPRELVPGYPERLAEIVMRALQRDPSARQGSAQELALELESFAHAAHIQYGHRQLAELMLATFGERPYPTPGVGTDAFEVDDEAATRVSVSESMRRAAPSRRTVAVAVAGPVIALTIAGAAWVRESFAPPVAVASSWTIARVPALPPSAPAVTAARTPSSPPVLELPDLAEPAAAPDSEDEPELVEDTSARPSVGDPRSRRVRARTVVPSGARADPQPAEPRGDARRVPMPARPNELFPPDRQGAPASE